MILMTFLFACQINSQDKTKESESINVTKEKFEDFYDQFYSDSIFQKSRIIIPIVGEILEWNENDSVVKSDLKNKIINITNFKTIHRFKPNAKQSIEKGNELCTEKIFIENSGFLMERKFILLNGKWFLKEYNMSNL